MLRGRLRELRAFDEAEEKGTPMTVTPVSTARHVTKAAPLDQLIISFEPQ